MNIKEALSWSKNILNEAGVTEPEASALVLISDVLNSEKGKAKSEKSWDRTRILAHPEKELSKARLIQLRRYINRRKKHESVWHIIGKVEFMGLPFTVNKDVLVPRPETELLVEQVIQSIRNSKFETQNSSVAILDVGTGSGTIIIALADKLTDKNSKFYIPDSKYSFWATDISGKALAVAKKNAKELKVEKSIKFIKADLFPKTGKFDIVTANLPYIPSEDIKSLAVDVHHFEPKLALDGGKGGLEIYERFLAKVGDFLKPNGSIYCEIGIDQGDEFKKLAKKYLPKAKVQILGDLAGIDRVAIISLTEM